MRKGSPSPEVAPRFQGLDPFVDSHLDSPLLGALEGPGSLIVLPASASFRGVPVANTHGLVNRDNLDRHGVGDSARWRRARYRHGEHHGLAMQLILDGL